jgi:transposase
MLTCLESGIAPHVITPDGRDTHELECTFEEADCDEATAASSDAKDLTKCLHAGIIPDAYKNVIDSIEVTEKKQWVSEEPDQKQEDVRRSGDEMRTRAAEGYFVRDPERNIVYCPAGKTLRQKCIKKNGNVRYANRHVCRSCKLRGRCCKNAGWKEVDFGKDTLEKPDQSQPKGTGTASRPAKGCGKGHYEKVKVVRIVLRPNKKMTDQRKCLSEHPFGTIKRAMGAGYFLLRNIKKVEGEFALMALGYNLVVAKNLLGFKGMMQAVTQALPTPLFGTKGHRLHLRLQQWGLRFMVPVYQRMAQCAA